MTKIFKLVWVTSNKVYFKSKERPELQRRLDDEFGETEKGLRKNIETNPMPDSMKIVKK